MRRVLTAAVLALAPAVCAAQEAADLAKKLANPVANLISVPLQFNYDGGYGDDDGDRAFVNFQPVIPFGVSEDWNVISRTILPVIWQDDVVGRDTQFGLGDTLQSFFLSPKAPTSAGFVWGVGPALQIPTATDDALGNDRWSAGPTGVVLRQTGAWTYGALANHIWSFAGDSDEGDVNSTYVQPFLVYTTPGATSFYLNTETTYDWTSDSASVPINAGVNQMVRLGGQIIQIGGGLRYWIDSPDGGPEGLGARVNLVFLFPDK